MDDTMHHASGWLDTSSFMPHGHCYLWTPELLWIYVISEAIIVLSYFSIAVALMYFVKKRSDLQFDWMFKLFSLFIFACGATHLMGIWTIWHPDYWLDAGIKAVTAAVSLIAAVLIWPLIPRALKIPGTAQLEQAVLRLQQEVERREVVEAELLQLKSDSDERFRVLFDQAAVGVAEMDGATGAILRSNRKYGEILGYRPEEMHDIEHRALVHPEDWPAVQDKLRDLMAGALPEFSLEQRLLHRNGEVIWGELTVSPLRGSGGAPTAYVAIMRDITARKQASLELKEQFDELQRWHRLTMGREGRVMELKREVNELLAAGGQPPRYAIDAAGRDETQA